VENKLVLLERGLQYLCFIH